MIHNTQYKVGGPDAVSLTVCHSCARTDRWNKLTARHYRDGGLCPGPIEQIVYVRDSTCGQCHGAGGWTGPFGAWEPCPLCDPPTSPGVPE